ncbi:MAG: heme ABC transporter permease CcmC [Pseudomonadota bacterium]|nr:heme ABC transporter permease CcmC [Pseudomonadota bacterium]
MNLRWFHKLASPPYFYRLADTLRPWLGGLSVALIVAGTYGGLVLAPPDYLQGDGFRMIYVHVPSAYLGMMAYVVMATAAAIGFIWRIKLAHAVAVSAAPLGASFTFLGLVTGAIWGKPMWGTFWQWSDARLVFFLVLFFLYMGYLALREVTEDRDKADRLSAVLAVVGVINIPIIHYSVEWWTTLHQGPTITRLDGPSITMDMLAPLLVMSAGFSVFFVWLLFVRLQGEILVREQKSRWAQELVQQGRV